MVAAEPAFDFERHFRNIYKEAKRLSTYQYSEDSCRKVKTQKYFGDVLPCNEYQNRMKVLLSQFNNKDFSILLSMRNKLNAMIGEEALASVYNKLLNFNQELFEKQQELKKKREAKEPPQDNCTIYLTSNAIAEQADCTFTPMARVFGVKDMEESDDYQKQCNSIAKLLRNEELDDEDEEEIEGVEELTQVASQLIAQVHSSQNITPKHSLKKRNAGLPDQLKTPRTLAQSLGPNGSSPTHQHDDKFGDITMGNAPTGTQTLGSVVQGAQTPRGTSSASLLNSARGTPSAQKYSKPPLSARGVPSGAGLPPRATSQRTLRASGSVMNTPRGVMNTPRGSGSIMGFTANNSGSLTARTMSSQSLNSNGAGSRLRLVLKTDTQSVGRSTPTPRRDSPTTQLAPKTNVLRDDRSTGGSSSNGISTSSSSSPTNAASGPMVGAQSEKF
eukprot:TRINITY_DN67923_c1_g1_i1.p1 TRINITY_DN67923_c1_g1~~TRINITY_DN67923_c1_g1_i1.p1  ORF type:complete len:444 (+),score=31.98 TRINITY_DN67923_c1_g1_i1:191-1522(+)